MTTGRFAPGDRLTHRFNPELGIGVVTAADARAVVVEFRRSGATLRLASDSDALVPLDLGVGRRVRLGESETAISALLPDGRVQLADGRTARVHELWPLELERALLERLEHGDVDPPEDFATRLDALRLKALREADGLGSFLGGRIRLFPHQLHVAERATRQDPVRWLLADEVGLGKTIEACLILNRLVHTRRVERCLVVAPETLTVQWLGELWRKHHQVFALLDEARLADVAKDFGADFNPFDVHRRAVIALETLIARPRLGEQAVAAGIDLLVVDEAQRLRRPAGRPGEPGYRAIAPIAALGRHVLLLSATPLEDDAHGFFRLLQLLRPRDFPEELSFEERLARREPLPPCTSSTRRADIGGLPPRLGRLVEPGDADAWRPARALEQALREASAPHALARRQKLERLRRGLASGAALLPLLGAEDRDLREQAEAADATDPRLAWLATQAPLWKRAREKTLVFAAHRETLELVRSALSQRVQLATGVFHEQISSARRDIEVARFRQPDGPSLLVSTECGGEGRNFEFCQRLVLFDLPWNPVVVEQRIGRLDRIGRRIPVEIVAFRPPDGVRADAVRLFEALGVFREPLAGLEPQLAGVEAALAETALHAGRVLSEERFSALLEAAHAARSRIREAAYQQLHREPFAAGLGEAILARVPRELDSLNEAVVVGACERLGLRVERQRGRRVFSIELGNEALVDCLPGVPGGASFLGSFEREQAVEDETLDFFASGHPLVEGVLAHLDESPLGRVTALGLPVAGARQLGLLVLYRDGARLEAVAWDAHGRERPDWAQAALDGPRQRVRAERMREATWAEAIARLGARLDPQRQPVALAALVVGR